MKWLNVDMRHGLVYRLSVLASGRKELIDISADLEPADHSTSTPLRVLGEEQCLNFLQAEGDKSVLHNLEFLPGTGRELTY